MTLFLFAVQVFSGILLLLYYRPSANEAYESVQFIVSKVEFGWLVRNVHSWSANLLIALAFAHFFSVFLLKSYRKPRELTWVSGVLLLFLMRQGVLPTPASSQRFGPESWQGAPFSWRGRGSTNASTSQPGSCTRCLPPAGSSCSSRTCLFPSRRLCSSPWQRTASPSLRRRV